jgi:nucleoside-specific outer membrane channel protein Tsx
MCGRLRCRLIYEYEQYVAARKELPKRNKRVVTPRGEGKVTDIMPMSNTVLGGTRVISDLSQNYDALKNKYGIEDSQGFKTDQSVTSFLVKVHF